MVRLSIIVPTIGQGRLERCLGSIVPQLREGDEVIVVGDLREGPLPEVEAEVQNWDRCWYLPLVESESCDWGHANLNAAMRRASGDWLTWTDDDDVYTPGAIEAIRRNATRLPSPAPMIFRYRSPVGYVVPPYAGKAVQGHISGQCLVVPNVPERFGTWSERYEGDFDMIRSTLATWALAGEPARWRPEIIGAGRPRDRRVEETPPVEWPASLESTPLYRFLTGAPPYDVPKPFHLRLHGAYALLSFLNRWKDLWWRRRERLVFVPVRSPDVVEQVELLIPLCEEGGAPYGGHAARGESNLVGDGVQAWIYLDALHAFVGAAVLRQEADGARRLNVHVLPHFRNRGHGSAIVAHVAREVGDPNLVPARTDDPSAS